MRSSAALLFLAVTLAGLACTPSATVAVPVSMPAPAPRGPETAEGTVQGVLRQVGNAPHIELVVSGESAAFGKGDYFVVGSLAKELSQQPLGPILVKGKLRRMTLRLAGRSGKTRTRMDIDVSAFTR